MAQRKNKKVSLTAADVWRQAAQADARRLAAKLPTWAATDGLRLPHRLAMEQCSSEQTARYKATIARRLLPRGGTMADLTGGYGVDFAHLAPLFDRAIYVERQEELCDVARHNFPLLHLTMAEVHHADAVDALSALPPCQLLFLDPARRDGAGRKVVGIADCEPNVAAILPHLIERSDLVLVKLSPMLDITMAVRTLAPHVAEVHVVAAGGECKELLLVITAAPVAETMLHVADGDSHLQVPLSAEAEAVAPIATEVGTYLYEPSAAVLKAGLFRWTAQHYGLFKLHPNTHLYTSAHLVAPFPGRTFCVEGVTGFSRQALRKLRADTPCANIAVRGFPDTVANLRRRLKIADGGSTYLFATTLAPNKHVIVRCKGESQTLFDGVARRGTGVADSF